MVGLRGGSLGGVAADGALGMDESDTIAGEALVELDSGGGATVHPTPVELELGSRGEKPMSESWSSSRLGAAEDPPMVSLVTSGARPSPLRAELALPDRFRPVCSRPAPVPDSICVREMGLMVPVLLEAEPVLATESARARFAALTPSAGDDARDDSGDCEGVSGA